MSERTREPRTRERERERERGRERERERDRNSYVDRAICVYENTCLE